MERWKVNLYTIWFAQVISYISFGFGLPFLSFYIQDLGVTEPGKLKMYTGLLNTVCGLASAISTPVWGILADKFGKKLMLLRAIFCATLIIAAMGMATQVNQLVFLRFAQGLFTGTVTAAAILVTWNTPREHLTYALGFLSSSSFIGTSIGPMIGGLMAEMVGYRNSFYLGALLMLANFLMVLYAVHENKNSGEKPQQGFAYQVQARNWISLQMVTLIMTLFFLAVARSIFSPFLALYVQEIRSEVIGASGITGMISGIVALMAALSGIFLGHFGDQWNKKRLLIGLFGIGVAISVILIPLRNLWFFTLVLAMLFLAIGGIEPIITVIASESTSKNRQGAILGILGFVSNLGFALAPMLGGFIAIHYSIQMILVMVPFFLLIALIIIWIDYFNKKGSQYS